VCVIEVEGVVVERPGMASPVLDGVSFRLVEGERAALLGGNGSGKTTLARLLNGTELPTRGRVLVDGLDTRDPQARVEVRRRVGLLFQDPDDQFVTTTAEREVAFGLENLRVPSPEMRRAVDAALDEFGLADRAQAPPHEMSGGEKARLALACVWVMSPRALALDETESLLDRRGQERLRRQIEALPVGTAILRITTDAEVACSSPRILVLHAGRLVGDGAPDDVIARLPPEVVLRTGVPLAWRLAAQLAERGRLRKPTADMKTLLGGIERMVDSPREGPHLEGPRGESHAGGVPSLAGGDLLLEACDAEVWYDRGLPGATPALHGVSLQVRGGDRVGLLGASGSGKSTLLHVLSRLLEPQRGRVRTTSERGLPSLVFQFPERQLFAETVREDVAYGLRESGVPATEVEERVRRALDEVGLPNAEFARRAPFHLSGGEMRRVALAGALAQGRSVLLLDEPTLGLDSEGTSRLRDILERLHARGVAFWVASHDADFVSRVCDRVVVLDSGSIAFDGAASDFWSDPVRATALGVHVPGAAVLADRLRALGARGLASLPDEAALGQALEELVSSSRSPARPGSQDD
jgi:energy-coupling factor transport system ATP-binding protein